MKTRNLILTTFLAASSSGELWPQDAEQSERAKRNAAILKRFPTADLNGDGTLSQEEIAKLKENRDAEFLKRFPAADINKDGKLTPAETRAFQETQRKLAAEKQKQNQPPKPDYADVKYGEHNLQALDLWLAESKSEGSPTPLCIFIHGGGFRGGDKSRISEAVIRRFLDQGISFVSMNYRLTNGGEFPYPCAMEDSARGLQLIRHRAAEWNIDPKKIVSYGGSAGAGISLWLAFHDDLADPDSDDPVSRQSTRLLAAGTMGGQSTYDLRTFRKWFAVPDLVQHDALIDFYAMKEGETAASPRVAALAEAASAITHLSKDDPPVYMFYNRPNTKVTKETTQGEWVHHPLLGLKLQEAMNELGLECIVTAPGITNDRYGDIYDFLIKKLLSK